MECEKSALLRGCTTNTERLHNKYGFGMSAPGLQPICGSTEAMGAEMNCVHLRSIDFEKWESIDEN